MTGLSAVDAADILAAFGWGWSFVAAGFIGGWINWRVRTAHEEIF
jgi:hypothetical protein